MKINIKAKDLKKLYETGKHKFLPDPIVKKFFKAFAILENATSIYDIQAFTSLNFEHLIGKRKHQHSLRLNNQWRLIIELDDPIHPSSITIIDIEDYH